MQPATDINENSDVRHLLGVSLLAFEWPPRNNLSENSYLRDLRHLRHLENGGFSKVP
jgi:hypothetical protein